MRGSNYSLSLLRCPKTSLSRIDLNRPTERFQCYFPEDFAIPTPYFFLFLSPSFNYRVQLVFGADENPVRLSLALRVANGAHVLKDSSTSGCPVPLDKMTSNWRLSKAWMDRVNVPIESVCSEGRTLMVCDIIAAVLVTKAAVWMSMDELGPVF